MYSEYMLCMADGSEYLECMSERILCTSAEYVMHENCSFCIINNAYTIVFSQYIDLLFFKMVYREITLFIYI